MSDASKVLAAAASVVGYHEGRSNGSWNNDQRFSKETPGFAWSNYQAWCDTFVAWSFFKAGLFNELPVKSAGCAESVAGFKKVNRFSAYPAVGAQVFFGPGGGSHTGIVESYDGNNISTIEGNTNDNGSAEGDGVYRKVHARRDTNVYGYGYPNYREGIDSADPAWAKAKPKPIVPPVVKKVLAAIVGRLVYVENLVPGRPGNGSVGVLQRVLNKDLGIKLPVSSVYDAATKAAVAHVQRNLGYKGADADGVIGDATLAFLSKKYHFVVVGKVVAPAPSAGATGVHWVTSAAINDRTAVSYARYNGGGSVDSWIAAACRARGVNDAAAIGNWTRGYQTAIGRESSGNANACNLNDLNNVTPSGYSEVSDHGDGYFSDGSIRALNGASTNYQPSRGVAQCIPQTFAKYHCPGTSDAIYDPVANIAASMGYVGDTYGVADDGHDLASRVQQFDPNRGPRGY